MLSNRYAIPNNILTTDNDFKIIKPFINEKHREMSYSSWVLHFNDCLVEGYNMICNYCKYHKLIGFLDYITFENFTLFMYNSSSKERQKYV